MTRINLVPPSELYDQHLLAEHREIKRIPNLIKSWKYNLRDIPEKYTMWKWHVKFFYDKIYFLYIRYIYLYNECRARGFNIEDYSRSFLWVPESLNNDYIPTKEEIKISKERLSEKYRPNFYKYKWVTI